ncbi:MAG: hypothetical protein P4L11_08345 [Geothrix sp.]|nr:hypothetical protein [Geothrix sp.]
MRRAASLLVVPLILASGSILRAQSAHYGLNLNVTLPTGAFNSTTYPAYTSPFTQSGPLDVPQRETYDVGLGANFTASFPVDRTLAIRLNVGYTSETGTNSAPGYSSLSLQHSMFNVGGDLQIFPQGGAYRHRGFYFLAGLSADFEQFSYSGSGADPAYFPDGSANKSRLGGTIGVGHTFGYDAGMRFNLEASFHKTLTGNDVNAGDPPSTDFVKLGFGIVF